MLIRPRSLILVIAFLISPWAVAADNTPPQGFSALFNGRDLTGWKGLVANPPKRASLTADELAAQQAKSDEQMRAHWKVIDGVLEFDGRGENICTRKDFENIALLVDWKIESGGDSGVYLRGTPQVQIWDTTHEPYFSMGADKGSGGLWNNQKHPRFPLEKADSPIGEWNSFRVRMIGEKVTVFLNDKLVAKDATMENYWERDKPIYRTGPIELQNHGTKLQFKNIYVREINP